MTDDQIWAEAAQKLYKDIAQINQNVVFKQFNFIVLHNIYLLTSFLYYQFYISVITDIRFDALCRYLLDNFEEAKKVIRNSEKTFTKDRLQAGTGFDLKMDSIWWDIVLHYRRLLGDESEMVRGVFVPKEPLLKKRKQLSFFD